MSISQTANNITGNLAQILFDGQKAMSDMAMKQVQASAQMQVTAQQQEVALDAVAMMTGVGSKIDTYV